MKSTKERSLLPWIERNPLVDLREIRRGIGPLCPNVILIIRESCKYNDGEFRYCAFKVSKSSRPFSSPFSCTSSKTPSTRVVLNTVRARDVLAALIT
jgi:hypothetical protein